MIAMLDWHFPAWLDTLTKAFPALLCLYMMLCAALQVVFREGRTEPGTRDAENLRVAILVPGRNEAAVLADCLESLLQSDYPLVEIHFISDGSTDGSVELALGFAERGVVVHDFTVNRGKSKALQAVLETLTTELVMVDADTRLAKSAVSELVSVFSDVRMVGATANIQVLRTESFLAKFQAVEYASIIGLLKRANSLWGGLFTVSGAASCFRTQAVRQAGGFTSRSITEDIDLSWRLQHRGGRIAYVPQAIAHVEVPETWRELCRQRVRWSQGLTEVLRMRHFSWGTRNPALVVFTVESVLCMAWAAALALGLMGSLLDVCSGHFPVSTGGSYRGYWHALSLGLFFCQTMSAALFDSHYVPLRWSRLALGLLYPLYFMVIILPTSLLGWARGLVSNDAHQWDACVRAVREPEAEA
jgi:poly-beta-1,6-N-acetyl-D-glucosamine synthase